MAFSYSSQCKWQRAAGCRRGRRGAGQGRHLQEGGAGTPHINARLTNKTAPSSTDRVIQQRAQRVDERRQRGAAARGCRCREELLKQLALLGAGL